MTHPKSSTFASNAKTVAVACPFCLTMIEDGMKELNKDAVSLAAGIFFGGMNSELSFGMEQSKPSDRCQSGLDDLLAHGYITSEKTQH